MNYPAAQATGYQESVVRSQNPEEQQSFKVPILLFFILNYQHTNLADDYRVTMQPDDWQTLAPGFWIQKILLTRCFQLLY